MGLKKLLTITLTMCVALFSVINVFADSEENSDASEVVTKNLLTGKETTAKVTDIHAYMEENGASTYSYEGTGKIIEQEPRTVFPPDDRIELSYSQRTAFPARAIAYLRMTFPDSSSTYSGTGFMIGENIMATCGHCVYDHDLGGWAETIEVIPATNGTSRPYGITYVTNMTTYNGWINSALEPYDIAVCQLETDMGNTTGWFGLKAQTDSYTGSYAYLAGYPGEPRLLRAYGEITFSNADYLEYQIDMEGGQSGSPLYKYNSEYGWQAIGVNRGEASTFNRAVRITKNHFDFLLDTY